MFPLTPMPRRARRACWLGVVVVALVVAAFSNSFGRAEPEGRYRPLLQTAALETGCYPLPVGVRFDFAHQVRSDGDVDTPRGPRRHLVVQWDLVSQEAVAPQVLESFTRAGFRVVSEGPDGATVRSREYGEVSWTLTSYDVDPEVLVQGRIDFDLPVAELASSHPQCFDPFTTKRFTPTEDS